MYRDKENNGTLPVSIAPPFLHTFEIAETITYTQLPQMHSGRGENGYVWKTHALTNQCQSRLIVDNLNRTRIAC
jgi:hypothetical protein